MEALCAPELLFPIVNGDDGLLTPELAPDERLPVWEKPGLPPELLGAPDERARLSASWMAPSLVVNDRPLSLVTVPGLLREPDDEPLPEDERVLTMIEREGCELRACVFEPRSERPRSTVGMCLGGKTSTDASLPGELCFALGCDRSPRPDVARSLPVATNEPALGVRSTCREKLRLGWWDAWCRRRRSDAEFAARKAPLS